MSVGIGYKGRKLLMTIGGVGVLGVRTKTLTNNMTPVDVSDDNADGWREILAEPGRKEIDFSFEGVVKNLELLAASLATTNGGSRIFAIELTYPDGSVIAGDFFMADIENGNEYEDAATFSASMQSTGEVTFTAGSGS